MKIQAFKWHSVYVERHKQIPSWLPRVLARLDQQFQKFYPLRLSPNSMRFWDRVALRFPRQFSFLEALQ